ncbi:hypothetical protein [Petrotoga sp. 9PWA.NaAc.5.4]|uniref:hypothetical protein n=1 Tax=Petrotoga sp. 9PWA.NaAc.5.4 TaxID=1434328 RepID=UPI000CCA0AED|nr:hypothetical protein [Petrotoga sp. 9PWA.NaAc.5.4]PNR96865.1 hypothetical protein X924_02785 [Petrotoga sp. 9PWA.NaAc.5.4]
MKKKLILLIFIMNTIIYFAIDIQSIVNLSKNPATLDISWEYFLKYIQENPEDEKITSVGELISAKLYFYNKYRNYNFVNSIISENLKDFCTNLGVLSSTFRIPAEDTKKIVFIFPQLPKVIENIINTGEFSDNSYKYLYKLEGLKDYINVNNYEVFIKNVIESSIRSPVFFDEDMKGFVEAFVPKNNLSLFEQFISESRYMVYEENYLGVYKLLTFLKDNNSLNRSIIIYNELDRYFSIKQKLTELNNRVYFVEKQELSSFITDIYKVGEELKNLTIEKGLLFNLYYSLLKSLNVKLENIEEKVPVYNNFETLSKGFSDQINSEILKLQMNIVQVNDLGISQNTKNLAYVANDNDKNVDDNKEVGIFFYLFTSIFIIILFLFIYFEMFPSYSKINFLCNVRFGKYAVHLSEKLILKNPEDYKAFLILAKSYEIAGNYNASVNAYKTAMNLKSKYVKDSNL